MRLIELAEIIPGFAFKSNDFGVVGEVVIKIKNINPPIIDLVNAEKVNISNYDRHRLEKYLLQNGDFVVAMTGATIGKIGRLKVDRPVLINQRVAKVKAKKGVNNDFVYYSISSNDFQTFIQNNIDSHSAQENISGNSIGRFSILLPSLPEQTAIAEILSSLDDKIDLLHRQNKTLEQLAETLFRQWFVEEENKPIVLGELAKVSTGKGLKRNEFIENGIYPILGANGEIGRTNNFLAEEKLILTGRVGTLGEISITDQKVWISDNVLIIKPVEEKYFYPIYFSLKRIDFENLNAGSTQPLVTQTDLKTLEINLASEIKLKEYEAHCNNYFQKIKSNTNQIKTLTQLRDTLLPKLMSGEVRVN